MQYIFLRHLHYIFCKALSLFFKVLLLSFKALLLFFKALYSIFLSASKRLFKNQRLVRASAFLKRFKSAGPAGASQEPAAGARKRFSKALQERRSSRSEPRTSGSARQARARTSQSTAGISKGQARADEAKHWVYARYERRSAKEFEDGRVRQAGLTRKLPSPALKEAERSGSYNPSALSTLTRETVWHRTVQGHTAGRATRAALCESTQT